MMKSIEIERIRRNLDEDGYAIVEDLIDRTEILEALRCECETLWELACTGTKPWNGDQCTSCILEPAPPIVLQDRPTMRTCASEYFDYRQKWPFREEVSRLFRNGSKILDLAIGILGPSAVLMNEQYIVKPGGQRGAEAIFPWHKDSQWLPQDGKISYRYISIWTALDDCDRENGCLMIKPGSHKPDNSRNDTKILELRMRAGSAVIMTESVEHCSGINRTSFSRRGWMPQFSTNPIMDSNDDSVVSLALKLT